MLENHIALFVNLILGELGYVLAVDTFHLQLGENIGSRCRFAGGWLAQEIDDYWFCVHIASPSVLEPQLGQ